MNNYVHRGLTLTLTAPYAVNSGAGAKVGNLFGIASNTYGNTEVGEFAVSGVFDIAKDSSVFTQGDLVYWDDTAKKATSTVSTNLLIGTAENSALTGGTTVRTKLTGVPGFSGQATGLKVAHALYDFSVDGGATCTPVQSDTIPKDAVVFGGTINPSTAVTSDSSATVAIGTTAGSASNSIKTATAKATFSVDAVLLTTAVVTPFKMTAAGQINFTVATGPLTAGVIEVWVFYVIANAD